MFEVNYFGAVAITQKFLPLIRQYKGRILNVSSVAGIIAGGSLGAYSGSKFALEALTDSLCRELAPLGVAVVIINPAAVSTKIGDKVLNQIVSVLPEQKWLDLYGRYYIKQNEVFKRCFLKADEPTVTTEVVIAGLFAEKPEARYIVANLDGAPAWLIVRLAQTLPTYLLDLLLEHELRG